MDLSTAIDIHEKKHFGITLEEILKFENDPENIKGYGGVLGIAKLLKVDPVIGINDTPEEKEVRTIRFGSNTYPVTKPKSYWFFLLEAFKDETLGILIGCAIASLIVGLSTEDPKEGWYDGGGVCFAVLLVVLVSSISNYRQTLQFLQLNDEKRKILINVCRSGRRAKIVIFDLVVGDVVHLSIGDQIPGDGILIEGHSLVIDESSMTGESDPMKKDEEHPFLLSGCKVIDGSGSFLITAVGMHTEWGKVMATLSEENDEETPLQVRLNSLAQMVGNAGISVAVCVFLVLIIRFLASEVNFKHFTSKDGHRILDFFSIAVTIVVVAVPEGLPLAVTLTLAYSMKKMMIDKALVRHLSACETMGCATTICSDKTGTLTMNQMTVVKSWVLGQLWDPASNGTFPHFTVVERVFQSACMNTTGFVHVVEGKSPEVSGSPTEVAVLNWAIKLGADYMGIKKEYKVLCVDTFNSTKKRMGIVIQGDDGNVWAHWKGASEIVLKECSHYIDTDGIVKILTPEKQVELEEIISSFAKGALRTLCLAFRQLEHDEIVAINPKRTQNDIPDQGLVCLAIVGIKDPCRPGVPEAVRRCQIAGIKVRMVTGDNIITAKAIATECGILTDGTAIEGKDFRNMSEEEQKKIIPSIQVMARSSPTDKHKLVQRLLEMGDIVAVTGDGTNDAPALHEASIGLSMGIAGTEVAKESSDIIILDDNFASIVKVVRWGRSVYANIQKFIQFQCTVNGVALGINFITAISAGEAPLTAVQLLWVNLIMDTMGALALATEPPDERLMLKKPVAKKDPLITNIMWRNMFGQFLYQLSLLLVLQFRGIQLLDLQSHGDEEHAKKELLTIIFNSFVFCQIFNEINARKPDEFNVFSGIFSNYIFSAVLTFTCGVQIILVQFLGSFTSTVQLSWQYWLICIAFGLPSFPIAILFKFIPVPEKPFFSQLTSPKKLIFREGGTIKGMLIRRNSKKNVDLKRLKSVRSQKFYVDLEQEVETHNVESSSNQGDCCLQSCLCCCMPSHPTPSPSNGTEKPSKKNAWK